MRTFLRTWALDDALRAIPAHPYRWLLRRLGIERGVHSECPGWCPCGSHGGDE